MNTRLVVISSLLVGLGALNVAAQTGGEIVFSRQAIDPANPAGLTDTFAAGDAIHAVAFFDTDLLAVGGKKTAKKVITEIFLYELTPPLYDYQQPAEAQLESGTLMVSGDALQNRFLMLDIVPDPGAVTAYGDPDLSYKKFGNQFDGPVKFAACLSRLEAGEHEIIVRVMCNYAAVAEGKFTITGDDFSAYEAMSTTLNDVATGLKTRDTVMPTAKMSDPALEAEMVAALKASQTYQDRIKGEVLKLVIIDPDWMIRRNELTGVILHRYIRAGVAVKNSDGSCTLWKLVTFQQDSRPRSR